MSAVTITTGTDTTAGESRRRAFFADLGVSVKVLTAARNATAARSGYESSRTTSVVTLFIGLLLAGGLGFWVARKIVQSLTKVTYVCDGLADGDLTRHTGLDTRDEPAGWDVRWTPQWHGYARPLPPSRDPPRPWSALPNR
ncbi:hypothetical protein [Actinoplanes awajinensis]